MAAEPSIDYAQDFYYSKKYEDDEYEYRHVHVPWTRRKEIPARRLLKEAEWRAFGIQQSPGWMHYLTSKMVLCFRRPLLPKQDEAAGGTVVERVPRNARRG